MSKDRCIIENDNGEVCVLWDEVWLEIEPPDKCESLITERVQFTEKEIK